MVTHTDSWRGATVLTGGKGYAATPMGQVHYRDLGPRTAPVPLLLLHQALMFMVQFAEIQNALAGMGLRSILVDTPGHGLSDLPPSQPTLAELADNLIPVLDHLGVAKVLVAGHHTGAMLAASLAARHPDRVAAVILHGSPLFDAQRRAELLAAPAYDRTPRGDGSHLGGWFRPFPGDPQPSTPVNSASRTWMLMGLYLMGPNIGHPAVFRHDMAPDAMAITQPTLILTDVGDDIHGLDRKLAGMRPDFAYQAFSADGPMSLMNVPERWAKIVADFLAEATAQPGPG